MLRGLAVAAIGAALLFPSAGLCAQSAGPLLAEQDVRAGWIALFDGATAYGWGVRGDAKFAVVGDEIRSSSQAVGAMATTTQFGNFALRLEFWADADAYGGVAVRAPSSGPVTDSNAYVIRIGDSHAKWPTGSIGGQVAGRVRRSTVGRWTPLEIRCEGNQIKADVDGRPAARLFDKAYTQGVVGLVHSGRGELRFRNIRLLPLGGESLFNGKDLTGWKVVSGTQAAYGVTREGWLNVRNGRGDLQTVRSFGDFVLQMEVLSNGEHLNSGIFFRANPDGFWSGYEVQIRNQWQGDNRAEPVDFGTGGIYNRQAARRVVSTDKQWFALTLVAHGLHFATWVDGVQVTDFVDTREVDNTNARRGARTAAGVISIQGHDPTTDLSFRNIRAFAYPEGPKPPQPGK